MKVIPAKLWSKFHKSSLARDTLVTTGWSTLGKSVGFIIPFFLAAWFGVTEETDAFYFAYGFILFFSVIFAPVVESVIVPFLAEAQARGEDTGRFVGNILTVSALGLAALAGLLLLVIRPILAVVTRFGPAEIDLVYRLLLITSPLAILLVLTSVLAGTLNAYKKFALPAIAPAFRAVVAIIFIFLLKGRIGVYAIALGYVAGEILRLVILFFVVRSIPGFRLRVSGKISPNLRGFIRTSSYQVVGMAALSLSPVVDKVMASWLGPGSVSIIYYADRLYMIPCIIFTSGLIITILSHWSSRYQVAGRKGLNEDLEKAVKRIVVMVLPLVILMVIFHRPIVNLAFGRGEITAEELSAVGEAWVFFLLGVVFYVLKQVYVRGLIVLKNTKIIMRCALYSTVLKVILNYLLMSALGTAGIALATTLVSAFALIYFRMRFKKI
ncbi:MAG: lipid II flippase MurJ [Candidatus Erginobacter occultus]|nr:lipid II flippase MurJ [Candidatus Erginobacter occultus]